MNSHQRFWNFLFVDQELKPEPDLLVEILQRTTAAESLAAQVVGRDDGNTDPRPGQFGAGAGWSNYARR